MTATCKYCGSQSVRWVQNGDGWRLLNETDDAPHRCPEYEAAHPRQPSPAKKNNPKSGAFLRCYGPRTGRTHALLVETRIPDPDTPAGMRAEIEKEDRKPQYYHLANTK